MLKPLLHLPLLFQQQRQELEQLLFQQHQQLQQRRHNQQQQQQQQQWHLSQTVPSPNNYHLPWLLLLLHPQLLPLSQTPPSVVLIFQEEYLSSNSSNGSNGNNGNSSSSHPWRRLVACPTVNQQSLLLLG
jgi:hypothetical protein